VNNEVHAIYIKQSLPDYQGNPFIEALPEEWSSETAIDLMSEDVIHHEGERELDAHYRMRCTGRLFRYFQPVEQHADIEYRLSTCIREGYINRSPLKKEYAETLLSGYEAQYNPEGFESIKSGFKPTSVGFTIIGMSGVGKSTAVERILGLYPQIIRHTSYNGRHLNMTQITWLKIDCPFDGSVRALCYQFFDAIDRILGTNHLRRNKGGRIAIDIMRVHMAQLAGLYCLGVLVIDEIQHLSSTKGIGSEKMLNFFVTLVNTIGIPVVLIGTTKAKPILQSQFRQARRGSGQQGDLLWDRMKKDISWDIMVKSMWKYQWTQKVIPLSQEMSDALYDESQGIIDIAIKLYAMVQIRAIGIGVESFSPKDFKTVASEKLGLVKPMLDALRSGDKRKIAQYEDIASITIEDYAVAYGSSINAKRNIGTKKEKIPIAEQAYLRLLELGVEPSKAKMYVGKIMAIKSVADDANEIIKAAYRLYITDDMNTKSDTSSKMNIGAGKCDTKSTPSAESFDYDTLKERGLIDTVSW